MASFEPTLHQHLFLLSHLCFSIVFCLQQAALHNAYYQPISTILAYFFDIVRYTFGETAPVKLAHFSIHSDVPTQIMGQRLEP